MQVSTCKEKWQWNNYDSKTVRNKLDHYMKLRGEVVHRSKVITSATTQAHPVTKDDLKKVISFLKCLVEITDKALIGKNLVALFIINSDSLTILCNL